METVLLSTKAKYAIEDLSKVKPPRPILILNRASKSPNIMIQCPNTNFKRQNTLAEVGIPGWLVCAWMMDKTITKYWLPRVEKLADKLGVSRSKFFNTY